LKDILFIHTPSDSACWPFLCTCPGNFPETTAGTKYLLFHSDYNKGIRRQLLKFSLRQCNVLLDHASVE